MTIKFEEFLKMKEQYDELNKQKILLNIDDERFMIAEEVDFYKIDSMLAKGNVYTVDQNKNIIDLGHEIAHFSLVFDFIND